MNGVTTTPKMLCSEIYNPGKEEITFRNIHPDRHLQWFNGKPPTYWAVIRCKPDDWCFLPHGYYLATVPSGNQEIKVIQNFGDQMFKGNKYPSAPEVRRKLY